MCLLNLRGARSCEWSAFQHIVDDHRSLLSHVRVLMVELHLTPSLGLANSSSVLALLNHVRRHGFKIYRRSLNMGFKVHQRQVHDDLRRAGFPARPCCIELHFVRGEDLDLQIAGAGAPIHPARCDFGQRRSAGGAAPRVEWLGLGYSLNGETLKGNATALFSDNDRLERRFGTSRT